MLSLSKRKKKKSVPKVRFNYSGFKSHHICIDIVIQFFTNKENIIIESRHRSEYCSCTCPCHFRIQKLQPILAFVHFKVRTHKSKSVSLSLCVCQCVRERSEMCMLEKRGKIFILTIIGSNEDRLNPTLIDAIQSTLHRVRAKSASFSALITTTQVKFFSNGFDLAWDGTSKTCIELMNPKLQSLVSDLISLLILTITAVSSHTSATTTSSCEATEASST